MKNWKTTLIGIATATVFAVTGVHDWSSLLKAIGIAFIGILAKDFNAKEDKFSL